VLSFYVVTLFPELLEPFSKVSLIGKACDTGVLRIETIDLREFTHDRHNSVDDAPYGGGAGMVMLAAPILEMLDSLPRSHRIMLTPQGKPFDQPTAERLLWHESILLFCGRYEGVDERVLEDFDEEISLGDFVLNGGEVAAMAVIEAVSRLAPGVLGNRDSTVEESFHGGVLEYPQYSRPEEIRGRRVPPVLLSGDHGKVDRWRRGQALLRTKTKRPDIFGALVLDESDRRCLEAAEAARSDDEAAVQEKKK
jgi:tRNA (guanine37-N1)-methyltransferase